MVGMSSSAQEVRKLSVHVRLRLAGLGLQVKRVKTLSCFALGWLFSILGVTRPRHRHNGLSLGFGLACPMLTSNTVLMSCNLMSVGDIVPVSRSSSPIRSCL